MKKVMLTAAVALALAPAALAQGTVRTVRTDASAGLANISAVSDPKGALLGAFVQNPSGAYVATVEGLSFGESGSVAVLIIKDIQGDNRALPADYARYDPTKGSVRSMLRTEQMDVIES